MNVSRTSILNEVRKNPPYIFFPFEIWKLIGFYFSNNDFINLGLANKELLYISTLLIQRISFNNHIEGCNVIINELPDFFSNFYNLTALDFNGIGISDNIIPKLSVLTNIQDLNMSRCTEITIIPYISSLINLNLAHCQDIKILDDKVSSLSNLHTLNLSHCKKIREDIILYLSNLVNIRMLDISYCSRITDLGISYLSVLTNIEMLNISYCDRITDLGIPSLLTLVKIKELNIAGCSNISNQGMIHLSNLSNLLYISIEDIDISKEDLANVLPRVTIFTRD